MPKALEQLIDRHNNKSTLLSVNAVSVYFFIAAVLIGLGSYALYNGFDTARAQQDWVRHTNEVKLELNLLRTSTLEAESATRGYLLSNDNVHAETYERSAHEAQLHIDRLRRLTVDNAAQQENLALAEKEIQNRFALLKGRVETYRATKKIHSQDSAEGYRAMTAVQNSLNKMSEYEESLLRQRAEKSAESEKTFIIVLFLTTIFTLVGVFFAYLQYKKSLAKVSEDNFNQAVEAFKKTKLSDAAQLVAGDLNLQQASEAVLPYVAATVNALVAKLFIKEDGVLKCYASYASESVAAGFKKVESTIEAVPLNHGLLGEAFRKGTVSVQRNLPKDFLYISSSLGRSSAQIVIFVPITFQGVVIGLIELGMIDEPAPYRLSVLEEYSEPVGVGINAAIVRENTHRLLEKTQQQAEELESQQEELRTSNEELEQQARALELQQESLNLRNQELEQARSDIENKASDLERTSRYKSEFLAKMSHELRTPLNSLLILASLLIENKEKTLTDKQTGFAKSIRGAGQDLLNLINDILDLSKIEARKLSLRPESFSLQPFFQTIQATFQPQLQGRDLTFNIEIEDNLKKAVLKTDRLRLEQILRNFVSNALKFTVKGQVVLGARERSDNRIAIFVRDSGVGIPQDKQKLIFEAFEQVDNSLSRSFSGTGLGLTISKELAHLLSGEINVESQEGIGSTFTVLIPRELPAADPSISVGPKTTLRARTEIEEGDTSEMVQDDSKYATSNEVLAAARSALEGIAANDKTILIVEDDDKFRELVAEAAEGFGLKPISTGDGEVALAILEMHAPSAVLLDIKLPGISGLGLLEIIKRSPRLRHIPTHMISALEHQHNALRSGAMGYLTKPVTIDKVKSALSRIEGLLSRQVKRLLIVEDDKHQQDAIRNLVEGKDIEIVSVMAGDDALKAIQGQAFDCIILDLSLPDMSGLELLQSIESACISVPPIVVYTGRDLTREEIKKLKTVSGSIIIKGAKSPERLLDEVNLFLHRVENNLPQDRRNQIEQMRDRGLTFEGRKALVVDDDLRNIFALTNALESKGFEVESAVNGIEALELLEKRGDIDVILMDIMMPKMDGFEATRLIRKMKNHAKTPIIALTAKAMKGDHENCIAAGASDYLPKPVNLNNLFSVLKVWLQNKGSLI